MLAPASGSPNLSNARAWSGSQPNFKVPGAARAQPTSVTRFPATAPQAKLIAPQPSKASSSVTEVLTTKLSPSTSIRLPWANSRVRKPAGTCATPSITTHRHITRSTPAASGEPSRPATVGAAANSATYSRPLERALRVSTVGANRRASPSQRTMARPTPSSFADSRTSSTVWAMP